jgi:hypothetical protein
MNIVGVERTPAAATVTMNVTAGMARYQPEERGSRTELIQGP